MSAPHSLASGQACTDPPDFVPCAAEGRLAIVRRLWLEVACAMLGRLRPSETMTAALGPGSRFGLHRGPISTVILPMSMLATCVDVPLAHLLLNAHVPPAMRTFFHLALLALNLGMLGWIFGERSAVCRIPHVVGPVMLRLRVGLRQAVDVPLSAVREVRVVKGAPRDWMEAQGISRHDVTLVTPMDEPNVLIDLGGASAGVQAVRGGRSTGVRRFLAVRVDNVEAFRRALVAAVP